MNKERIQEIKALCEAAESGPWTLALPGIGIKNVYSEYGVVASTPYESIAKFIAAARQIIPELLEALENKAAEVELWENGVDRERAKRQIEEDRAKIHHEDFMKLAADRDRWKARAGALERAIKEHYGHEDNVCAACYSCAHLPKNSNARCDDICGEDLHGWQFDEARFAPEGSYD